MAVLELLSLAATIITFTGASIALVNYLFHPLWLVSQGESIVIERYGVFNREGTAGWCWVNPFVDRVRKVEWRYAVEDRTALGTPCTKMELFSRDRIPVKNCIHVTTPFNCQTADGAQLVVSMTQPYDIVEVKRAAYVKDLFLSLDAQLRSELQAAAASLTLENCDTPSLEQTVRSRLGNLKWAAQNGLLLGPTSVSSVQSSKPAYGASVTTGHVERYSTKSSSSTTEKRTVEAIRQDDIAQMNHDSELRKIMMRGELSALKEASDGGLSDAVLVEYLKTQLKWNELK